MNPYQSPAADAEPQRGLRPSRAVCMLFGLYAGSLIGGTFGTAGLVLGSLASAIFTPQAELAPISAAAIGGFAAGAAAGGILGPPLAWMLRATPSGIAQLLLLGACATLLALANAACAAAMVPSGAGIILAPVCGMLGGLLLVRRLGRFVLSGADRKQPSQR